MKKEDSYFRTLSKQELWQRYCGFLDLSVDQFINIQQDLLMDQMKRVGGTVLGKKILGDQPPKSVEEFRERIPLTKYEDYEPYLSEQDESALAEKPGDWCHSSGKGGHFKWMPYTNDFLEVIARRCITGLILGSCNTKGEVNIAPGVRLLIIFPPPPYTSGVIYRNLDQKFSFRSMPPQTASIEMDFQQRVQVGFEMALKEGIDCISSLASVLVNAGKKFSGQTEGSKFNWSMLHPYILPRLLKAKLASAMRKGPTLPRDIWPLRGVVTGGVDVRIYEKDIKYYWGVQPHEIYGATELGGMVASQSWTRQGLNFFPDVAFLEFLPCSHGQAAGNETGKQAPTVLLNEVEEGKCYELVISHLYGMPLFRYRMGDVLKVAALKDDKAGVNLPQFVFERRLGETINIGALADLDEKTIWKAITNTGVSYNDWTARKEYDHNQSFAHIYIETSESNRSVDELAIALDEQLRLIDTDYKDIDSYLNIRPIRVTFLSPGTFKLYIDEKMKEGADLAHLKPSHMNAPDEAMKHLLELDRGKKK
ncbi:MAG: GH3 auxin-responsive promoter family protein [Chloroflexota bacterium]